MASGQDLQKCLADSSRENSPLEFRASKLRIEWMPVSVKAVNPGSEFRIRGLPSALSSCPHEKSCSGKVGQRGKLRSFGERDMPMPRDIGLRIFFAAVSLGVRAAVYGAREWHDQMPDGGRVDC